MLKEMLSNSTIWVAIISAIGAIVIAIINKLNIWGFAIVGLCAGYIVGYGGNRIIHFIDDVNGNELSTISAPFEVTSYFHPSGQMGDYKNIQLDTSYRGQPRPGDDNNICIKITSQPNKPKWAGIYWQYPDSNWGDKPGRRINGATKIGATKITFWARGDKGDEIVEFKAGGIRDKKYKDSFEASTGKIKLKQEWNKHEINLSGMDLSHVIGAFAWAASKDDNPQGLVFYLDDIRYEK